MNELPCEEILERIPDLVDDALDGSTATAARAHLEACAECRATWELAALLRAGRPTAPADLADRITRSIPARRGTPVRPWWGIAAAAVAALALGIGVSAGPDPDLAVPAFVAEAEASALWPADDGLLAGAPALGELSEEALLTLLDEMGAGASGGAA